MKAVYPHLAKSEVLYLRFSVILADYLKSYIKAKKKGDLTEENKVSLVQDLLNLLTEPFIDNTTESCNKAYRKKLKDHIKNMMKAPAEYLSFSADTILKQCEDPQVALEVVQKDDRSGLAFVVRTYDVFFFEIPVIALYPYSVDDNNIPHINMEIPIIEGRLKEFIMIPNEGDLIQGIDYFIIRPNEKESTTRH